MAGGRPQGSTSAKTRQRQADEEDPDGSKRAALKANFFSGHYRSADHRQATAGSSSGQMADVHVGDSAVSSDNLAGSSSHEQSVEISAPHLPAAIKDRVEGTLYTTKEGAVGRWNVAAKELLCVCDPDTSSCAGNVKLRRCRRATGAADALLGKRVANEVNYRALDSGTGSAAPASRRTLLPGELERLRAILTIPRSDNHAAGLVIIDDGCYHEELMGHDDWSMSCRGISFPIRSGLQWRKTFRGRHASAVNLERVTILFEASMSSKEPERPVFKARSLEAGIRAVTFRACSVHDLERRWLAQSNDPVEARDRTRGTRIIGDQFVGFDNIHFAQHLRSVTPGFVSAEGEEGGGKRIRGSYKDEIFFV